MKHALLSFVLILSATLSQAAEPSPEQRLQTAINQVVDTLHVSDSESTLDQKRQKVLAILDQSFSFDIIIRRALSRNWNKLNASQQKQVEILLTDLLIRAYTKELLDGPRPEIEFLRTEELSSNKIEIPTKVSYRGNQVAVNYRLANIKNRGWQVYDVLVEGVSLVNNYREQFDAHFQTKGAAELLDVIKNKLENFNS